MPLAGQPFDAFAVRGREVYLRLVAGMAETRLTTAWFDAPARDGEHLPELPDRQGAGGPSRRPGV